MSISFFHTRRTQILKDGSRRFYSISRLPRFLILHVKRFVETKFLLEKNPTIVNFPVKNLELRDYVTREAAPTVDALRAMSSAELKKAMKARGACNTSGFRSIMHWFAIFVLLRVPILRACLSVLCKAYFTHFYFFS
jgi:hypothetical protein